MKHEFTDQQIDHAMGVSQEVTGDDYILEVSLEGISAFLEALPDQTDEWERCEFSDIRKGDRVRAEFIDITYEGTAVDVRDYVIAIGRNRNEILRAWKDPDLYRIPAPVQHPDPLHDLTILVHGAYGNQYRFPTAYTSDGSAYNIVGIGDTTILPKDITDWTPGKVIADE